LYDELRSLGSGAFGEVFVVKYKNYGKEYAVKIIRFQSMLIIYVFIICIYNIQKRSIDE